MKTAQRHRDPTKRVRVSHAPYNFVPLTDRVYFPKQQARAGAVKRFSGEIDYRVVVKTPLFVGNGPKDRTFFQRQGEYTIPGTTVRGTLRPIVRTISFGGFHAFEDRYLVFRDLDAGTPDGEAYNRLMKQLDVHAGFLTRVHDNFYIRKAATIRGNEFVRVDYSAVKHYFKAHDPSNAYGPSDRMWVCVRPQVNKDVLVVNKVQDCMPQKGKAKCKRGVVKALLFRSGDAPKKTTHYAFFEPDADSSPIPVPDRYVSAYLDDLKKEREKPTRPLIGDSVDYRGVGEPVFYYMLNNELYFFGPTRLSRLRSQAGIGKFVPEGVRSPEHRDMADVIFGTSGFRGKVFVGDARIELDDVSPVDGPIRLGCLCRPRPESSQHYLVQARPDDINTLATWHNAPEDTKIRGAKFYWHKPGATGTDPTDSRKGGRKITPITTGSVFKGKIRFEDLSELELGCLLSAINLPQTKAHRMGLGKPFGLGSVGISSTIKLFDRSKLYSRVLVSGDEESGAGLPFMQEKACEKAATGAVEAFRSEMIHFYNDGVDRDVSISGNSSIWDIPGIRSLGLLLEWTNAPAREKTSYMGFDKDDAQRWARKAVLPSTEGVASRTTIITVSSESVMAAADEVEVWERAVLTYEPGPRVLCISHGQKKTEMVADRDMLVLSNLSNEVRNRLVKKKKAIKIIARVAREGNKYSILEIWPGV